MPVREFIAHWYAERRGTWVIESIRQDLERHGVTTRPSFEYGYLDNYIRIGPAEVDSVKEPQEEPAKESESAGSDVTSPTVGALVVGQLPAATSNVVHVNSGDSLQRAQSLMIQNDFSQLPVLNGPRNILGVVSWESIAVQLMHNPNATLKDCIVPVNEVRLDDDLLPQIPQIVFSGYVLVLALDGQISGIVTTADLSQEFLTMAGPFLLIGECERHLRSIVAKSFDMDSIIAARDPSDSKRSVENVSDLTLGEIVRLFEQSSQWDKLQWHIDRGVFVESLNEARELRNEVMHFSTDPIEEERLVRLRNLIRWLKVLAAQ